MTAEQALDAVIVKRAVIYLRVSTTEQAHAADAAEGYSIPAQRDACRGRAADLGAQVVAEFVDRGESARSAARPELRRMLVHLAEHGDIDYVIVHKVDRLARNRADDVEIQLVIEKAGAQLVSVTEALDDSPSGRLVRNIMADLAEFYSANLATEILKGSTQKARLGGTPHRAPIGYLNIRQTQGGQEIRTVVVDEARAPFVRRAFYLYGSGDWSLARLHQQLTAEGLTARPTPKRPAVPLSLSKFAKVLRNKYYTGIVSYRGVEYPGRHEPLVGPELFDRVQRILDERDRTALKLRVHTHYLRGLLNCRRCGARLLYSLNRGRRGGEFAYYVCGRRHRDGTCDLPYLSVEELERQMEQSWPTWVRFDSLDAEAVRDGLRAQLAFEDEDRAEREARARKQLEQLDAQRVKLLEMAYADAIPLDLLAQEQARVTKQRAQAEHELVQTRDSGAQIQDVYQQAEKLMRQGAATYQNGDNKVRRLLHRAFLDKIEVDVYQSHASLASPWKEISQTARYLRQKPLAEPRRGRDATNPGQLSGGRGSNINPLVELRGQLSNPEVCNLVAKVHLMASKNQAGTGRPSPSSKRHWRLVDRLGKQVIAELLHDRRKGATKQELVDRYGVSMSSVKRLIQRKRQ